MMMLAMIMTMTTFIMTMYIPVDLTIMLMLKVQQLYFYGCQSKYLWMLSLSDACIVYDGTTVDSAYLDTGFVEISDQICGFVIDTLIVQNQLNLQFEFNEVYGDSCIYSTLIEANGDVTPSWHPVYVITENEFM